MLLAQFGPLRAPCRLPALACARRLVAWLQGSCWLAGPLASPNALRCWRWPLRSRSPGQPAPWPARRSARGSGHSGLRWRVALRSGVDRCLVQWLNTVTELVAIVENYGPDPRRLYLQYLRSSVLGACLRSALLVYCTQYGSLWHTALVRSLRFRAACTKAHTARDGARRLNHQRLPLCACGAGLCVCLVCSKSSEWCDAHDLHLARLQHPPRKGPRR